MKPHFVAPTLIKTFREITLNNKNMKKYEKRYKEMTEAEKYYMDNFNYDGKLVSLNDRGKETARLLQCYADEQITKAASVDYEDKLNTTIALETLKYFIKRIERELIIEKNTSESIEAIVKAIHKLK